MSDTTTGLGRPAALGRSDGRPGAEERALAELFTQLGRELTAPRSLDEVLAVITRRAVEVVPAAEHAAVSRSGKNGFETVASTSDVPARVDSIQYRLGTGPCVDAVLDDATYRVGELAQSNRWREFGREAAEKEGIHSMLSVRLFLEDDDLIAGLNLYSGQVDAFDDSDDTTATLLATHGALAVAAARNRDKAENLQRALITSRRIGIAMGILMATHKVTEDQAFGLLRIASQSRHRKLADLAVEVAEIGMLELPPLPRKRAAHDGPRPHPR